ncbi:hypothetical protein [Hymenobacter sp. PAMC 26628]|uniref:hypothetical protein n=1 Tax=Hymenobacter sp. PAMC 26628 TaxID=1484118 RepID=UPI0007702017|nr:hypothetical protein [Hymenobacter sp. PAMC 26628]AMJ65017.1 hypothetical protein AXW84_05950 [Hymenobacter sp. PAMC 26628]
MNHPQPAAQLVHDLHHLGHAPYLLPTPAAVGPRARCTTDVWVFDDMQPALRRALAEWGGQVLSQWPAAGANRLAYFTLSLAEANDLFEVARTMVRTYYAEQPEGGQAA